MPRLFLIHAMLASVGALLAMTSDGRAEPSSNSVRAAVGAFQFSDALQSGEVALALDEGVVVKMDPLIVEDSYEGVGRAIREHDDTLAQDNFKPREGGTIAKHVGKHVTSEVKLKFDQKHKGFDVLSFSW